MTLSLQNLSKRFAGHQAVDGISLDLQPGEILALLGPSGCGKTTTLRMVAGFEKPDDGVIAIGGQDVSRLAPYDRQVGVVFQDYALFPHMTVAQNVEYGLRQRGVAKADRATRSAEMLRLVRLEGLDQRRATALSGGQQQRVALARALAITPKLLLLDEPLSNLDAKLRAVLQVELRQILSSVGISTLLVTHDQEEAMTLADRVAVMNAGKIEQIGSPREVYETPATRFVANFLGHCAWFDGKVERDGEKTLFKTEAGDVFTVPAPARVAPGYGLAVRPERIALHATPEHENRVTGTIVQVIYHGHALICLVQMASGYRFGVPIANDAAAPAVGDRVTVGIRTKDCLVVAL